MRRFGCNRSIWKYYSAGQNRGTSMGFIFMIPGVFGNNESCRGWPVFQPDFIFTTLRYILKYFNFFQAAKWASTWACPYENCQRGFEIQQHQRPQRLCAAKHLQSCFIAHTSFPYSALVRDFVTCLNYWVYIGKITLKRSHSSGMLSSGSRPMTAHSREKAAQCTRRQ